MDIILAIGVCLMCITVIMLMIIVYCAMILSGRISRWEETRDDEAYYD